MTIKIGSLFSGAGGLDIAIEHLTGGETVFHAEIAPAAAHVLAAHWPGVPNLGDVSAVDWSTVGPVDVLALGFPCQDVSQAGLRAGMGEGTRSGLWAEAVRAIVALAPPVVVIENVRGLLTTDAGDGRKAMDVVLGGLEAMGYGYRWALVTAASVGAPHRRERVFIVADKGGPIVGRVDAPTAPDTLLLPTPQARDGKGVNPNREGDDLPGALRKLLPTPQARDGHGAKTPAQVSRRGTVSGGAPANLNDYAVHRLPWPGWGPYAPAVTNWEAITETVAPTPVEPSTTGGQRLTAEFSEWMMGWPAGWVTDLLNKDHRRRVPGMFGYIAAMRVIGNGVCAHQAVAALTLLELTIPSFTVK